MAAQFPRSVTIFGTGTEGYGIRRCLLGLADSLDARGIRVNFVLLSGAGRLADALAQRPWPVVALSDRPPGLIAGSGLGKLTSMLSRGFSQLQVARKLRDEVRRAQSDVILVRSPLETVAASLAARATRTRAFWLMPNEVTSGYPLDLNRRLYRAMFRHGRLVPIANSRFTDSTLGAGDFKRFVAHLGIDPCDFNPELPVRLTRAESGIPEDALVIGLFARMVENKGQLQMVRAMAALGEAAAGVHLLVCGGPVDTPYARQIVAEARAAGMADRVHMMGEQTDMLGFYQLSDILANSRIDPEPFGFSVIEGLMLGKPVLAHAAGGPSETIIDGETGWLIPTPDLDAFTAGLGRALADRPRWSAMGAQARTYALEHFTADKMTGRVLAVMEQFAP